LGAGVVRATRAVPAGDGRCLARLRSRAARATPLEGCVGPRTPTAVARRLWALAVAGQSGIVVQPSTPHPGATILVVDDEPAVRKIAARVLERGGWVVLQAPDAAGALARRLRERWPNLPIIFLSGFSVEELRREGTDCAVDVLVQKPFAPGELVAKVAAVLGLAGQ
jgi:CheY-like chemotaxis protein